MTDPLVVVDDVTFAYPGGPRALDGVSMAVAPGEVLGIAGVNGAGKSTLARHLNGLLRPTGGRVLVAGRDTRRHAVADLVPMVGLVFQDPRAQLFARTVSDELAFGPRNLGLPSREVAARVAAEAARFGLEDVLGASPLGLPAPRRRLVALAAVLAMQPRVLVLDEPTTGQDHRVQALVADLARSLAAGGMAVVCVSHDLRLLAAVSSRLLVLAGGRVALAGATRDVFADEGGLVAAGLAVPQVVRLGSAIPGLAARRPTLTVDEVVTALAAAGGAVPGGAP